MPTHFLTREQELPMPDDRAYLDRMPGSQIPVIHQPWADGDRLPYWAMTGFSGNHLYDLKNDPGEEENLTGTPKEAALEEKLREALKELEAPNAQFERLGLS